MIRVRYHIVTTCPEVSRYREKSYQGQNFPIQFLTFSRRQKVLSAPILAFSNRIFQRIIQADRRAVRRTEQKSDFFDGRETSPESNRQLLSVALLIPCNLVTVAEK